MLSNLRDLNAKLPTLLADEVLRILSKGRR